MRKHKLGWTLAALALVGLGLAGCGDDGGDGGDTGQPTEATPTGATPTGGATGVAECVVGDWRTSGVEAGTGGEPASINVGGGGDVAVTIGADGATTVDFAGMEPVSFDGEIAGVSVAGDLSYGGSASGTVRTDPGVTSGAWEPVDSADWSGVTLTVNLTEPVTGTPLDQVPIGDAVEQADQVTGEVIDIEPVLGTGSFECDGDTLVLRPTAGDTGLTWTLVTAQ
ncbi:MAG TPA: hypothetical protein VIL37_20065 [Natronosporangium sp.]